ncbi:MAG: VWA domain-containing protein [Chthoniobacteraceae bacterium]
MKHILTATILALLPLCAVAEEKSPTAETAKKPAKQRIEVCFVLDTTGSMGGLIAGAKAKIWSMANDIISAKPTPEVRFALIGYRDRGDDYVTKITPLTDDLDAVYAELNKFQAGGGGDGPESVGRALDESVKKIEWTKDSAVLKIIYLVGDAPPHFYDDEPDWKKVCVDAVKRDLIINAVQCGGDRETTRVWKEIADRSEGSFFAIPQDGGVVAIAAPQDKELSALSEKIGGTMIAFGDASTRRFVAGKQALAETAAPAAAAARLSFNSKSGKTVQGTGELLDAIAEKKVTLDEVKKDELPEELRKLSSDELKAHVEKKQTERAELQKRITELSKARDAYIDAERKKLATAGKGDGFDEKVSESLRAQAKKKGIRYE